jgi:hypothetical protein
LILATAGLRANAARFLAQTAPRHCAPRHGHRPKLGQGAAIQGSGVALMLAICGRIVAFDQLDGPGVPLLQSRLS